MVGVTSQQFQAHNFQARGSNPRTLPYLDLNMHFEVQSRERLGPSFLIVFLKSDSTIAGSVGVMIMSCTTVAVAPQAAALTCP